MQYNTYNLTLLQKISILNRAKEKCIRWWVDELDCYKSFHRRPIYMSFEDIMAKFDQQAIFNIVYRKIEDCIEISFRSTHIDVRDPEYFLWIVLDPIVGEEFTKDLKPYEI